MGKIKAARKAIKWGKDAWNHVMSGHVGSKKKPDKTKFCLPCEIKKLAEKTVKDPDIKVTQRNGNIRYEKTFDKAIGTKGEKTNVVITNGRGGGVTAFPKKIEVPGAALGVGMFGDNYIGQICDFFNPLSDLQDLMDFLTGADDEED